MKKTKIINEEGQEDIIDLDITMNFEDFEKKFKSMRGSEPDFETILTIIIENNFDPSSAVQLTD